jgi:hypothetical protein
MALMLVPRLISAQEPLKRVTVVQVAGANLYLNAGTDSGVRTGDTLTVSRARTGAPVGAFAVIATTSTSSIVGFVGTPFPVTRGDSLFIKPGAPPAAAPAAQAATPPRTRVTLRATSHSSGAVGLEASGSTTTIIGLGADPLQTRQDVATPALRFRWGLDNPGSGTALNLNFTAEHRAGPSGLFYPQNSLRIYEARLDQSIGHDAARVSLGRFLALFDHSSGYWDGMMVHFAPTQKLSGGFAAGYEPLRANETFSTDTLKYAGFLSWRSRYYHADAAVHQTMEHAFRPDRPIFDWSQRLDAGAVRLLQDLQVQTDPFSGRWTVSRFQARAAASMGPRDEIYAAAVSDLPPAIDTAFTLPLSRRERGSIGIAHHTGRFFVDLDGSVSAPRDRANRGYAGGLSFGLPPIRGVSLGGSGSYFYTPVFWGVMANPSLELRGSGLRARLGYEYFLSRAALYSVTTHGGDFLISHSLARDVEWTARINGRYGSNIRSVGFYTGMEVRFR